MQRLLPESQKLWTLSLKKQRLLADIFIESCKNGRYLENLREEE